mmetsp:Transcript_40434/g.106642  ORF Transcript_40434/g.106642 Transcript_40434/m.106642 type:complete len:388 (+) Transcript_40434:372-1535(+)
MALSLTTQPEAGVEQHFRDLLTSLDEPTAPPAGHARGRITPTRRFDRMEAPQQKDVEQRLRRLQKLVRQRLHTAGGAHVRGPPQGLSHDHGRDAELISRVQRNFRANRAQMPHSATSRRRAALAIERFYLKRRREPYRSPNARAAASALLLDEDVPLMDVLDEAPSAELLSTASLSSAAAQGAPPEQLSLIRATQAKFRARQHRKKAVRVIEAAYGEWKFHAEQARLAAQGERDPSLHNYHAERRERAARCIQGYLQRQQRKDDVAPADGSEADSVYTDEQLELIRRAQRAFRAHIRQHAEEAQELHHATASAQLIGDAEHSQLCDILRRCAVSAQAGHAHLSPGEAGLISKLQQSFRDNLERKRRAVGIISDAWLSSAAQGARAQL